ncbi:MAG TPA: alpha-E domain-containing protein [Candidatus Binatia bacterium]|nr:alpha-E domain-containing protein [Candidatus Binatia bacterium]
MLSRLADNLYWFGRYLQRAENTARLVNVNTILSMDLPRRVELGWEPLVDLVGARAAFAELYAAARDEQTVVRFLSLDERNPGSIVSSLHRARETLRTTRDYMPGDVWARINDLYFLVQDRGERSLGRSRRQEFLDRVMEASLGIHGLLVFNMSHDVGFHFFSIGVNLEQADMTTRIVDARSTRAIRARSAEDAAPFEAVEWMSVLRSLTAQQTYRRQVRHRIAGAPVARFLLQNAEFPRSVSCCLQAIRATLPHLPSHPPVERALEQTLALVRAADVEALVESGLKTLMDEIQQGLDALHEAVSVAFFRSSAPTPAPAPNRTSADS